MKIEFKSDFGESGRALGHFETSTKTVNVNLEGIFLHVQEMMYGGFIPEEYQCREDFEDALILRVGKTVVHETIHGILLRLFDRQVCCAYDNVNIIAESGPAFKLVTGGDLMGLREAGRVKLSKSGRALEIVREGVAWDDHYFVPLEAAKEVIEGKKASAKMSLLVHDSRQDF